MRERILGMRSLWVVGVAILGLGCSGSSGGTEPGASPTEPVDTPAACVAASDTVLSTDAGDFDLGDAVATVKMVVAEDGCTGRVEVDLVQDGGCRLQMVLAEADGGWSPVMGQLVTHPACGASSEMTYNLNTVASTAGIVSIPATDGDCASGSDLALVGLAHFVAADGAVTVRLDDVVLTGDLEVATGDVSCPEMLTATCTGQNCGEDAYGVNCGTCAGEQTCEAGSCADAICPPKGPFGVDAGDTLTDLELPDCDGNMHRLHDMCGARAGFVNLLSGG